MGVQIAEIFPKEVIELEQLKGRTIAIDAFLWLYQFLSIIRQRDGTPLMDSKGRITSHLSGVFYRNISLLHTGIRPVWVFDGKPPVFKSYILAQRSERKTAAALEWKKAVAEGDLEKAKAAAGMSSKLTDDMVEQAKELLGYMGIPVVQAPSEGEAQCAEMCKSGIVWAVASQDSDSLMFGSPRLVRNLSITGKRKLPKKNVFIEVKPELIQLKQVLDVLGITREQLIILGMLVGTDFNPGIKGIGPKRALIIIKELKSLEKVIEKTGWNSETAPEDIYNFFLDPPVEKNVKISFKPCKEDKIRSMLIDEFEFSQERIEKSLAMLKSASSGEGLGRWVKK